jgi:predicted Zn-dependent protease
VASVLPWLLVTTVLAACASPAAAPTRGVEESPPRAQAEREETVLLERSRRLDDPGLDDYLARVAERLRPASTRSAAPPPPRVVVLRDATLAAFAAGDALVVVHAGLLSRLASEDELAMILARELAHVDAGDARGAAVSTPDAVCGASSLAARSRTATVIFSRRLHGLAQASMTGYGRERERAADVRGLAKLRMAGYGPEHGARVFPRLRGSLGADGAAGPFLLGCPRWLDERAASLRELLAGEPSIARQSPTTAAGEFAQRVRVAVRESALLHAQAGRFDEARGELDRVLTPEPGDAVAYVYEGDLLRLQAQAAASPDERTALLRKARESYERAAALDPRAGGAYRQLGLLFYQEGALVQAREAFERYLDAVPDAADAARIREYVAELRR